MTPKYNQPNIEGQSIYERKDKNNTIFTLVLRRMTSTIRVKVGEFPQQLWEKSCDENRKQNEWTMDCVIPNEFTMGINHGRNIIPNE